MWNVVCTPRSQTFESYAGSLLGSPVVSTVFWSPTLPENILQRDRLAQGFVTYIVNSNPDFTCFRVDLNNTIDRALAIIDINYYGNQFRVAP